MASRPRDLLPRRGSAARHVEPRPDDSGAAAVEFALILIPLLLLIFGIVNFGFMFAGQISMNAAARDAARAGVVRATTGALTCAEIVQRAKGSLTTFTTNPTAVTITVRTPAGTVCSTTAPAAAAVSGSGSTQPCTSTAPNTPLTVDVRFAYTNPVPIVPPYTADLTASGIFRCEYT